MEIEKQPIGSAAPNLADCPALLQRLLALILTS